MNDFPFNIMIRCGTRVFGNADANSDTDYFVPYDQLDIIWLERNGYQSLSETNAEVYGKFNGQEVDVWRNEAYKIDLIFITQIDKVLNAWNNLKDWNQLSQFTKEQRSLIWDLAILMS